MRVLAEMGLLLVLGLVVGLRSDGVFIAGLLLAVSVAGLVEWLRPAQWSWVLCTAYLVIAVAVPSWCAFMPLIAILHGCRPSPRPEPGLGHGLRQVAAPPVSRGPRPLAVPLPMQCVRPRGFRPPRAGYGCCR